MNYSKKKLAELEQRRKAIEARFEDTPNKAKLLSLGIREHIAQIQEEISEYLKLKTDSLPSVIRAHDLEELKLRIVEIRIQRKMSQADLASKIGCKQSHISRMERIGYGGLSFSTLRKIAHALNTELELSFITAPSRATFNTNSPRNITTTFSSFRCPLDVLKPTSDDTITGEYANA